VTYAVVNGAGQLGVQAPFYALPVIVLLFVSSRANASFYVAWTIATVVFLIVQSVGQALLVEGDRSGALANQVRSSLRFGILLSTAMAVACIAGSRLIPVFYGSSYEPGARILPILGLAAIPWAIFTVVLSAARVRHDHRMNLILSSLLAAAVLAPALLLAHAYGIDGAAAAWLIGNVLAALGSLLVLRRLGQSAATEPLPSLVPGPSGNDPEPAVAEDEQSLALDQPDGVADLAAGTQGLAGGPPHPAVRRVAAERPNEFSRPQIAHS
jgi:hypothetical protein